MLGKIVNAGVEIIIYSPVEKTSQSGLFSNKRLALLSLPQATIGYLSKMPEPLTTLQDITIMNKCKQKLKMNQIMNLSIKIDDKNASILHLSWVVDAKQKKWEFKFENQQIADEWIRYIQLSLQPPKPDPPKEQQTNLNFSKIQSPKSRFTDYYFPKPKDSPKNIQKTSANQYSYNNTSKDKSLKQQPEIVEQKQQTLQQSFTGRFRKFEQNNKTPQKQEDLPIITTFSQKFSNHNLFNTLGNSKITTPKETFNWNLKWFEEIQTQPEEVYLHTYSLFVQFCKGKVTQIVKEITYPKRTRKFIPSKITNQQQFYYVQQVTFKLTVPFSINSDPVYLSTNQNLLKEYEQELQNNRLILKATRNKGAVKVPLVCIVRFLGFIFYCEAIAPPNYKQVEQSMIYLFQKQLQKLQQKISLSLSQTKIRILTNRPEGPPQRPNKSFFIIVYNLKYLTPRFKLKQNLYFYFPPQYYLYCEQIVKVGDQTKRLKQIEQFSHKFLNNQDSINCRIISNEDLNLSLHKHMLDRSLIYWLATQCKSKYLYSLLATEIIAEYFLLFVWVSMSKYLKDQDEKQVQFGQFEGQISIMFSDLVRPQGQSWQIISDWLFATHQVIIKQQEIILGYLFSSISQKIGLQLDYQLLRSQRPNYFSSRFVLSKKTITKYFPAISKQQNRDICFNYDSIQQKVFQVVPLENNLKQVIAFYSLQSGKPNLLDYNMRALCRFLSFFIAIDQQKGFEHLKIYEGISLRYLDINVFQLFISGIKWLLLYQNQKQVLQMIAFFNQICGFWVGQKNPFSIILWRLLGEYYNQKRNLEKAINYSNLSIENTQKLFSGDSNIENLDTDYKLAYLYLNSNKHKQALQKFKKVKKTIQKQNKQSLVILDLMVEIAKLYLHLGAIDKCLYYAKQAIKFATLYPFKTQQQQFLVYQLILRCLQIQSDTQKMKFYIDLIQDKFAQTSNSWVMREVLKLTITQIVLSTTTYYLKKMAFFMYLIENQLSPDEVTQPETQKFKALRVYCGNAKYPQILKQSIENCPQIVDQLVLIESEGKSYTSQHKELWINEAKRLQLFCQFIGQEYILGQIITKLNQPDLL